MKDMIVRLVFNGDARSMDAVLQQSERRLKSFGSVARREFDHIKNAANSLQGKLAALGVSFGAVMLIKQSAELDKGLIRIGQTAGETRVGITGLRAEFFRMGKETGQSVDSLKQGFDNAVQAGLNFKEALPVTDAVSKAMAVTGASADQLTAGLTVAATAFQFDLAQPGKALTLLDKMTVAGRQGNAELENLSSIFARVGVNASRAGMGFDQTLGFIEGLSLLERQPERLATLADSTLRLFTNIQYMQRAQKVTGVKFFDAAGGRRDPLAILTDIKTKYDAFKTDQQRSQFMGMAFKGVDIDTQKGLQALLTGDLLRRVYEINRNITQASGTIVKGLPDAIKNAVDQTGRLKTELRRAADGFIQPLNEGITRGIKKLLDAKKDGGLELSGKEIAGYGAATAAVAYMGYRLTGGALKKLLGSLGQTGVGIGEGKAIEYATGVTPVFVVNMPGGGLIPGMPGGKGAPGVPGIPGGPGTIGKAAPILAAASFYAPFLAAATAMVIPVVTATLAAKDVSRGGSGKNWISEGWSQIQGGVYGDMLYDYMNPEVKNDFTFNFTIDHNGRVITDNSDPNTRFSINLNRGSWANPLGAQ